MATKEISKKQLDPAVELLRRGGLVELTPDGLRLTEKGERSPAAKILAARRRWGVTDSTVLTEEAEKLSPVGRRLLSLARILDKRSAPVTMEDVVEALCCEYKKHHARHSWPDLIERGLVRGARRGENTTYPYALTEKGRAFKMFRRAERRREP